MELNKFLIRLSLIPIISLGVMGIPTIFISFLIGFCDFSEFLDLCLNLSATLGIYGGLLYSFLKENSQGFDSSPILNNALVWFYFCVISFCCLGIMFGVILILLGVGFKSSLEVQVYFLFLDFTIGGFSGKLIYDAFSL